MRTLLVLVAAALALPVLAADEPIPWEEAGKHIGEQATVEGRVVAVHCSQLSCLLAFEKSFNRFTAVVQAHRFDALPPADLESRFKGKRVQVRGKIEERDGKPEIVVDDPQQIALASERRREQREAEKAAEKSSRADAEMMDRMANVLARVEDLTERLAGVEERMDTLLTQLEQREAALAAAQANQPPPPPPPSYGEPQPRPGFETLRTLKRGMSRAEVERLVGVPQYVESSQGWTTWYYGYGRSVSFDSRGHVASSIGFPPN